MKNAKNPNHPAKGSSIKVEPIRDRAAIKRIKKLLDDNSRHLALFTLGINVAFRANELVALNVDDYRAQANVDRSMCRSGSLGSCAV